MPIDVSDQSLEESYFNLPKIVQLLLERGAKEGRQFTDEQDDIQRPRQNDLEFAEIWEHGDQFIVEQQPYFSMWRFLYEFESKALSHSASN